MLTRKRIPTLITMNVGEVEVRTKTAAKYLGVTLDCQLRFWEHLQVVCNKASKVVGSLSGLMRNVGGPRTSKRRLLMSTVNSILLYGAEVWAGAMRTKRYSKRVLAVQRTAALRVACAYRTVSALAVMVVAGVIPLDLLAVERQAIFADAPELGRKEAARAARETTLRVWQRRWDEGVEGRWTYRLIGNLVAWVDRGHGEIDFFLCQFLTGHGYFRKYLHLMGKIRSPRCSYCPEEEDDTRHTFFECGRFDDDRRLLASTFGVFTPDSVVGVMLESAEKWGAVASYVQKVLRTKRDEGCLSDT
jgi:hypothetical protein